MGETRTTPDFGENPFPELIVGGPKKDTTQLDTTTIIVPHAALGHSRVTNSHRYFTDTFQKHFVYELRDVDTNSPHIGFSSVFVPRMKQDTYHLCISTHHIGVRLNHQNNPCLRRTASRD